jgi:hypothetical protein
MMTAELLRKSSLTMEDVRSMKIERNDWRRKVLNHDTFRLKRLAGKLRSCSCN